MRLQKVLIRSCCIVLTGLLMICGLVDTSWASSGASATVLSKRLPITVRFELNPYTREYQEINGKEYLYLDLPGEARTYEAGMPDLPLLRRSLEIPARRGVKLKVVDAEFEEFSADIVPSKGHLKRSVDPAKVPYQFDSFYSGNGWYPASLAQLGKPYIMRDKRGVVLTVSPFQYNPALHIVKVCTSITVEISNSGPGTTNLLKKGINRNSSSFSQIYANHFLNSEESRYDPIGEEGELLIITYDSFNDNIQPLKSWKESQGITTTVVNLSTIGTTAQDIGNYIQDVYTSSNLAFVLLVGDAAQVPTPVVGGYAQDPRYALLAGGDMYPEILVGRFSAETDADVDTQVERTIEYERGDHQGGWFWKGVGIGSDEGPGHDGEYDREHIDHIRDKLLAGDYTEVDQLYEPFVTDTMVTDALNDGRGIINYCGHGSKTSWGSSGFSNTDINGLVNNNELPFIISVACINGEFPAGSACFAEAWLRATDSGSGDPTGAVAMYASSHYQSWAPPMDAQDEINDRYLDGTYDTFGAMCIAGAAHMMDLNGSTGEDEYLHWHIFGDPSLNVRQTAQEESPAPDIKVNGQDGPLTISSSATAAITVSLDSGSEAGVPYDWWIYAVRGGSSKYWWTIGNGWVLSADPVRAWNGELRDVTDFQVDSRRLPPGDYTLYFSVDQLNDVYEATYEDSLNLTVD